MNIRIIDVALIALAFFAVAQAQDDKSIRSALMQAADDEPAASNKDASPADSPDTEADADDPEADDPEAEEEATESGSYEEEDGFIPSEDVSSDQSLRFPVDI